MDEQALDKLVEDARSAYDKITKRDYTDKTSEYYSVYTDPTSAYRMYNDHKGYAIYRNPNDVPFLGLPYTVTFDGNSFAYKGTMRSALRAIRKHRRKAVAPPKLPYYEYPMVYEEAE